MRWLGLFVLATGFLALVGCSSGEVTTSDVESWQQQGAEGEAVSGANEER